MSEIPGEFISKKTFKTLPQLAFWTWLIVFIVDAVVLQRLHNYYTRVALLWIIGIIVALLFERARYKNLDSVDKSDYGNMFVMLLNGLLIFLYASSYTGLTKQIGAWGQLQSTINQKDAKVSESGILLKTSEWAIPVLAEQTSYFPDIAILADNNKLKSDNKILRDSLQAMAIENPSHDLRVNLNQRLERLNAELIDCKQKNVLTIAATSHQNDSLKNVCSDLSKQLEDCKNKIINSPSDIDNEVKYNQLEGRINRLIARIDDFNSHQAMWNTAVKTPRARDGEMIVKRYVNNIMSALGTTNTTFYDFMFKTPIKVDN